MKRKLLIALALVLLVAPKAFAVPINWTDWTSATVNPSGSATGVISSLGVTVGYTGDVTFAQLGSGTNFWTEGDPKPYTGNAVITNAPTPSEMIALSLSGIKNTLTFSSPLLNPVMAIVSQGQYGLPVSYDFDRQFTVLSEGRGYWGDGWYSLSTGDILTGYELHGAIQFSGMVSSISWVASPNEYWHGITVGASTPQVPEPATMVLLGSLATGLFGFAGLRKRFTK